MKKRGLGYEGLSPSSFWANSEGHFILGQSLVTAPLYYATNKVTLILTRNPSVATPTEVSSTNNVDETQERFRKIRQRLRGKSHFIQDEVCEPDLHQYIRGYTVWYVLSTGKVSVGHRDTQAL